MTKLGHHTPKAIDPGTYIPVQVQPPCEPDKARYIGFNAPYNASEEFLKGLLRRSGIIPEEYLDGPLDAKVVRSKKNGDRWSIVL